MSRNANGEGWELVRAGVWRRAKPVPSPLRRALFFDALNAAEDDDDEHDDEVVQ